ncbi:MAG: hypothetical protein U9N85_13975 [Bacteroidota bacterium]|nr:hypothetical protein [Bacteroidota bacterium]
MAKAKRFNAFSGVFTPSILTILGVIMYLRLGWVVAEAGLIATLVIILLAHVISITTSLSISSVATDKKIKTGGLYYILSRSLGLPMGGAIGIGLFVATALGISLYIVGFAESLLAVDSIREFLGLSQSVNSYRIVGTAAILTLVTIAFISTSLAIKTQYYILAAIFLSLVSIIWGFFDSPELVPAKPAISPAEGDSSVSLAVVFGVYFPAVTGFTAGVAMSGDLVNPKKDIPRGTLFAVAVGFVIYVGLAIAFAFLVERNLMLENYNFLMELSYFPPIVLAGIWGATLSSALGGILGGPRILQAISKDKLTPKIFAKGYGSSNEPRNALLFIFIIAEAGILIGELNAIAGLVSMFYLASYGFINIAFFLEKWASTDFRPTFKVSRIVGLIGFIAAFGVMFQLNMLSMFGALFIMFLIYFFLRRKTVSSEFGDVWHSVWLTITRIVLNKMNDRSIEERNWQPNIILFSGRAGERKHLVDFGKSLVGKYGMLSNFDLVLKELSDDRVILPRQVKGLKDVKEKNRGVFIKRRYCSDIYSTIEMIASTYGFSGVEPNTILMGWGRQTSNPKRFSQMVRRIRQLDLNMIFIDYDKRFGYGDYEKVDIWWRSAGNYGTLAFTLMKFIWSSKDWQDAKLRLLIANDINEEASNIKLRAEQLLDNLRLNAEIKVINNEVEKVPFYDIVRTESVNTDLTFLNMLPLETEIDDEKFVEEVNELMQDIGTVVMLSASSYFTEYQINSDDLPRVKVLPVIEKIQKEQREIAFTYPENTTARKDVSDLREQFKELNNTVFSNYFGKVLNNYTQFTGTLHGYYEEVFDEYFEKILDSDELKRKQRVNNAVDRTIKKFSANLNEFYTDNITKSENLFQEVVDFYISETEKILNSCSEKIVYKYKNADLKTQVLDDKKLTKFKYKMRLRGMFSGSVNYTIKYKNLVDSFFADNLYVTFQKAAEDFGLMSVKVFVQEQKLLKTFNSSMAELRDKASQGEIDRQELLDIQERIKEGISKIEKLQKELSDYLIGHLQTETDAVLQRISDILNSYNINKNIVKSKHRRKAIADRKDKLRELPALWKRNNSLGFDFRSLELKLIEFDNKLVRISSNNIGEIDEFLDENIGNYLQAIREYIHSFTKKVKQGRDPDFAPPNGVMVGNIEQLFLKLNDLVTLKFQKMRYLTERFPKTSLLMTNKAKSKFYENQYSEDLDTTELKSASVIDFILKKELQIPIIEIIEELPGTIVSLQQELQNVIRFISFSFYDSEGSRIADGTVDLKQVETSLDEQLNKIDKIEENFLNEKELLHRKMSERLSTVVDKLNVPSLLIVAESNARFGKNIVKGKTVNSVKRFYNTLTKSVFGQLNKLWYRPSEAVLLRKSLESKTHERFDIVNRMLNLTQSVSLNPEIEKDLPFFYKQLFLRENNFNQDLWYGRKKELEEFKVAVSRYENGYHGAIAVAGESHSGKTFMISHGINQYLSDYDVFSVSAPKSGSVSVDVFEQHIFDAVESKKYDTGNERYLKIFKSKLKKDKSRYQTVMNNLPKKSVIVIENMELWWEKTENGSKVIQEILKLVDQYSDKCLIIIGINMNSFHVINKINKLDKRLLNTVYCSPVNAETLKNIVSFRHHSGSVKFKLGKKSQDDMRPSDYAKLFAGYFKISQGNIGHTLFSWLSNIDSFNNGIIQMHAPVVFDDSVFNELSSDTNILLLQFVLHRNLDFEKAARVSLMEKEHLDATFSFLKRTGFIKQEHEGIYRINPYVEGSIVRHLKSIRML